jgi:hypothetical protein
MKPVFNHLTMNIDEEPKDEADTDKDFENDETDVFDTELAVAVTAYMTMTLVIILMTTDWIERV